MSILQSRPSVPKIGLVFLSLFLLAFGRMIPHPPNFTPILSLGILSGILLPRWVFGLLLPLGALLLSDYFLGFYSGMIFVYLGVAGSYGITRLLKYKNPYGVALISSVLSNVWFFLVSNYGVWLLSSLYTPDWKGLVDCYVAAIPFVGNTLGSTLFYSLMGVVVWSLAIRRFDSYATLGRYETHSRSR